MALKEHTKRAGALARLRDTLENRAVRQRNGLVIRPLDYLDTVRAKLAGTVETPRATAATLTMTSRLIFPATRVSSM